VFNHLSTGAPTTSGASPTSPAAWWRATACPSGLGNVAYERDGRSFLAGQDGPMGPRERDYGEETGNAIDAEVRSIVDGVLARTLALLRERRDALERSARRLLEKETLDEAELLAFAGRAAEQAAERSGRRPSSALPVRR
jgi:cell division protease FtsH